MPARNQLPIVVVGAGSAGVVVASRLAADPSISVLLLESNSALGGSSVRNYMVGMTGMRDDYEWERDLDAQAGIGVQRAKRLLQCLTCCTLFNLAKRAKLTLR